MSSEGVSNRRGKWSEAGVPHHGWSCIGIEDVGDAHVVCEMCEHKKIRFVHEMRHARYPAILRCGCHCAGEMESSPSTARTREAKFKSAAKRRLAWPDRKAWKTTSKGNYSIFADGFSATVFRKGPGWKTVVDDTSSGKTKWSMRSFADIREAKLAAYDDITSMQDKK